jgi:hypothetical protein
MTASMLASSFALRGLNADIRRRENPNWWIDTRRVHPDRQIKVPMVRSPQAEVTARGFFAKVAHDPELLCRRMGILLQWTARSPSHYVRA